MFSRLEHQLPTFLPLGAGLLIVGLVTVLGGLWNYQNELDNHLSAAPSQPVIALAAQKSAKAGGKTARPSKAPAVNGRQSGGTAASPYGTSGTAETQTTQVLSASAPGSSGHSVAVAAKKKAAIAVSLSINGQAKGSVLVASGSTQCDVLSQALAQGVIHSLDMRYNSQWGTEGVYVINGIGDPGTVRWIYEVNG